MNSGQAPNLEQLQQENDKLKSQIELLQSCVRFLYGYANSDKPIGDICNICEECYTAYSNHNDAMGCCTVLKHINCYDCLNGHWH